MPTSLASPGVSVSVTDESYYTPAEPGTTPLIVVATAENKPNGSSTGTAPGTIKANAGILYSITSQKDLVDTFGDPSFKTDSNNNPIHAGEQNEYGLQAAYSYLGVSNRAYVIRADLDLNQLDARADEPGSFPDNGTYWLDTQNTIYGIFEWNGAAATVKGGQMFTNKIPHIITDTTKVVNFEGSDFTPKASLGSIGDYAVVAVTTANELYFKNRYGAWVLVGSNAWQRSWPTIAGTKATFTFTPGFDIVINGIVVSSSAGTLQDLVFNINSANIYGGAITASIVNNKLELYNDGTYTTVGGDSTLGDSIVISAGSTGSLVSTDLAQSVLGIKVGTYYNPKLSISKHTDVPEYKKKYTYPRPTGSLWIKTTKPNMGARWRFYRFNGVTNIWEAIDTPIYQNSQTALYEMDKIGGGLSLPVGALYINSNFTEDYGLDETPLVANFKPMRRSAIGETVIKSLKITSNTMGFDTVNNQGIQMVFSIAESVIGSNIFGDYDNNGSYTYKTISFVTTGSTDDADMIAGAINAAGLKYVYAEVDSLNRVSIKHRNGGDFRLRNLLNDPLLKMGFTEYNFIDKSGTLNLYAAPIGDSQSDFVASLWEPLNYTANDNPPETISQDGTLWYSSIIDEVDIMINDGKRWVGYRTATSPYYATEEKDKTNPSGPIVSASIPEVQIDGTLLVTGDIWIDSSDTENYPTIYKYNAELENKQFKDRWILVDKTDQSTEDGILFDDARYNTSGENSNAPGSIPDLLESSFVDFDAPDPVLYPKGMLLWNLRRSGFNVKQFKYNYVSTIDDNIRYSESYPYKNESMEGYYPHRWVTASPNQLDGSGSFGRKAQRAVVVKALKAMVNSNQVIRDEEGVFFNLLACPGYPELIGEMINLNYDRGLTTFVVGDTPARLSNDATSLTAWGLNKRQSFEDNDDGAVTYDEYMGMFYPWGITSDNFGNNIVVPPSHMILRTIALSDQQSYQWFAPAGLRRGGITNAKSVGYVTDEGEFKVVSLNNGQRDALYDAKINPITSFTGAGLVNFGQKTRAKANSALDRINVARLVIYLRRQLGILAKPYIFEPNDKITRDELKAEVESLMLDLVSKRGLYDYMVVCDNTNNTPTRIDKNELWVDIAIEPVKAVEFIYIPLRLKNTGEIKSL